MNFRNLNVPRALVTLLLHIRTIYTATEAKLPRPYGTKTVYDWSFAADESALREKRSASKFKLAPSSCKPIHISGLFRHGSRYPSKSDITHADFLHSKLKEQFYEKGLSDLHSWKNPFTVSEEKNLADLGKLELQQIGQRTGQTFYECLHGTETGDILFLSSNKSRTIESSQYFRKGLQMALQSDLPNSELVFNDRMMRPYDNCEKYIKMVKKNKPANHEFYTFREGPEIQQVVKNIQEKVGPVELSSKDLKTMYVMCAIGEGLYGYSPWCNLLTLEDLEVLEYTSDLKNYWRKAHGHPATAELATPVMKDIFMHMQNAVNAHTEQNKYTKAVFRFGHAETVQPLYGALGLFLDDIPPRAGNFQQKKERLYKSTKICPFAANVMLILYACDSSTWPEDSSESGVSWPDTLDKYMVQVLVNELPVKLPICEHDLCPFEKVMQEYQRFIYGHSLEQICSPREPHTEL